MGKWSGKAFVCLGGIGSGKTLLLLDLEGPLLSYRTERATSRPTEVCLLSESLTIMNTQGNHSHGPVL